MGVRAACPDATGEVAIFTSPSALGEVVSAREPSWMAADRDDAAEGGENQFPKAPNSGGRPMASTSPKRTVWHREPRIHGEQVALLPVPRGGGAPTRGGPALVGGAGRQQKTRWEAPVMMLRAAHSCRRSSSTPG